ncbi:MAG: hypothetical protein IKH56_02470 [Oscillospiraceae bacterium]|nr:hypothetical protein [Oscillospiraceae bacterium]
MRKILDVISSDNGMKVVNVLFFLAAVFSRSWLAFAACGAWILWLAFCIRRTESRTVRTVYAVLIGIAAIAIGLNLYFLLRS